MGLTSSRSISDGSRSRSLQLLSWKPFAGMRFLYFVANGLSNGEEDDLLSEIDQMVSGSDEELSSLKLQIKK